MPTMSLRARLSLFVVLAFLPMGLVLLHARQELGDLARGTVARETLQVAHAAALRHGRALAETRVALEVLSRLPGVRENPGLACEDFIPSMMADRPYYTVVGVIDASGRMVCTVPALEFEGNFSDRGYFREAFRTGEFAMGSYQVARITGRPSVTLAQPVPGADGEVAHLLAAGIDLEALAAHAGIELDGRDATVTVFDREGTILVRFPEGAPLIGELLPPELAEAARAAPGERVLGSFRDIDGQDRIFALAPLAGPDPAGTPGAWVTVGFDPSDAILGAGRVLRDTLLGLLLMTLLAAVGIWLMLEFFLLRRLSRISGAAEAFGDGDWDARVGDTPPDDEVASLARAFDGMAARVAEMRSRETRRARDEIHDREERFRQMAENIESVFWLSDPLTTRSLYVSPAVERIWGRPAADFMDDDRAWTDSLHPDDRDEAVARLERAGEHPSEVTYRIIRPDGGVRWIRDRIFPVKDEAGEAVRIAGMAEDVTAERHLEDQLRQAQRIEAVGRLAGGIAHDFNNIITAIMGHTQLLLEDMEPDSPLRFEVEEVLQAARRAASLTGQLLAFSRKQVIQPRRVNVNEVVTGIRTMLERAAGDRTAVAFSLAPDPPDVIVDPGQLEQVLLNLVVNSRDALPRGGAVEIRTEVVEVDAAFVAPRPGEMLPGRYVRISVTDDGEGIDPEIMDHIFEPFFTTKEVGQGTGLGLATVYGIVKQAGGFVWTTSSPGAGTTFDLYFPPAPTPTPSPDAPSTDTTGGDARGGSGGHDARGPDADFSGTPGRGSLVLLVEPDLRLRRNAHRVLESAGFQVLPTASAREALALVEAGVFTAAGPDVLLARAELPGVPGPELATMLRKHYPELPAILTSDSAVADTEDLIRSAGSTVVLPAPLAGEELLVAVRRILLEGSPPR
ncbi:MAG: PAS domain S-box protein [Gemmatimonadales bacterium]|nr:MAG: PAS domain S-box protein [Gemmatimonadales bacterium]